MRDNTLVIKEFKTRVDKMNRMYEESRKLYLHEPETRVMLTVERALSSKFRELLLET